VTVALRPAVPLDAGAVGGILSEFIDRTPWMPRLHSRAEEIAFADAMIARGWVTVAEGGSGVAGFMAREGAEVHALYVAGAARRTGCGRALIAAAQARAARLELWCFAANAPARAFYAAQGFTERQRTDGARNDEKLPDIRLAWDRGAAA